MHEKVEHLFAQKTQRQNKLTLPVLSPLLKIFFNVKFSIWIFTSNIISKFNRYFIFLFIFFDHNFTNIVLRAKILHKVSEPFMHEVFELSRILEALVVVQY